MWGSLLTHKQFTSDTRVTIFLCLLLSLGGCAGVRLIEPAQVTIDPNSCVVAFSVNTSTSRGSASKEYGGRFRASHLYLKGYDTVRLSAGESGSQMFVLEPPTQVLDFGQFFLARSGENNQYHFGTIAAGPRINLTPGEITYLGRLEIEDIQFEKNANWTTDTPIAIKLVFKDASEDDFPPLQQQYEIFRDRNAVKQIIGRWGELEYEPVRFVRMTSSPFFDALSR